MLLTVSQRNELLDKSLAGALLTGSSRSAGEDRSFIRSLEFKESFDSTGLKSLLVKFDQGQGFDPEKFNIFQTAIKLTGSVNALRVSPGSNIFRITAKSGSGGGFSLTRSVRDVVRVGRKSARRSSVKQAVDTAKPLVREVGKFALAATALYFGAGTLNGAIGGTAASAAGSGATAASTTAGGVIASTSTNTLGSGYLSSALAGEGLVVGAGTVLAPTAIGAGTVLLPVVGAAGGMAGTLGSASVVAGSAGGSVLSTLGSTAASTLTDKGSDALINTGIGLAADKLGLFDNDQPQQLGGTTDPESTSIMPLVFAGLSIVGLFFTVLKGG